MPNITKISIEHYRGFYEKRDFFLGPPTGRAGSGLMVLVGPNNAGKSTVLDAIRLVLNVRQVDQEYRHEGYAVSISLTNDDNQTKTVSNPELGAVVVASGSIDAWPRVENIRIVPSRRAWSPYTQQQRIDRHSYWTQRYNAKDREEDTWFISRIADLGVEQRAAFDVLLKELLPQLNKWRIELSRGQTFIQYETQSGARHAADLFGDGMASLFRVALALFESGPGDVICIDEPELSLHPQAQKNVATVLSRLSSDRQIIVTTHSPYFVNWCDISAGATIYRLTQTKEGISVGRLKGETVRQIERLIADWQKPNLLDAVSREIFFADSVLFLEGQEDVGLLKRFAELKGLAAVPAFGYGSGGAGNIRHFLSMARDLGLPAAAIFDGDHADTKTRVENDFPEYMCELLPVPDIRDKPRKNEFGKETSEIEKLGLFDRSGTLKPEYDQYLTELLSGVSGFLNSR